MTSSPVERMSGEYVLIRVRRRYTGSLCRRLPSSLSALVVHGEEFDPDAPEVLAGDIVPGSRPSADDGVAVVDSAHLLGQHIVQLSLQSLLDPRDGVIDAANRLAEVEHD